MELPNVMNDIVDLTQLRTFLTVAQEGHLTRAAERLHISQPTASNHIRALETQFGVKLFSRTPRGLEPTAAGARLAQSAAQVLGSSLELTSLASQLRETPHLRLSFASLFDERLMSRLPALVSWMQGEHPALELNVEARNSRASRQGIRSGEIDASFFVGSALEDDMDGFALGTLDYVVAGPYSWRQRLAVADWREIAGMPWVVTPKGTATADLVDMLLRPRGLEPRVALAVNHDALLRAMICGGVGIGLVRKATALEKAARHELAFAMHAHCTAKLLFGYLRRRAKDPGIQLLLRGMGSTGFAPEQTQSPG